MSIRTNMFTILPFLSFSYPWCDRLISSSTPTQSNSCDRNSPLLFHNPIPKCYCTLHKNGGIKANNNTQMGCDIASYLSSIGLFYCKIQTYSFSRTYESYSEYSTAYEKIREEWKPFVQLLFINISSFACLSMLVFLHSAINNTHFTIIVTLLLMQSMDIYPNPGPHTNFDSCSTSTVNENQYLTILHLNARSIRKQLSDLSVIFSDFHSICFTEKHLDDNVWNYNWRIWYNTTIR